jgi:hypothetical protein
MTIHLRYTAGIDLGPTGEPTGFAIVEREARPNHLPRPDVCVRHLERFLPGAPWQTIIDSIAQRMSNAVLRSAPVIVDQTAVGSKVVQELRPRLKGHSVLAITITAGTTVDHQSGLLRIPKTELITTMQWLLQNHNLKIAPDLAEAETLLDELAEFRMKRIILDRDELLWRERPHDDLVLAVALATWHAERHTGVSFPPRVLGGGRILMPSGRFI